MTENSTDIGGPPQGGGGFEQFYQNDNYGGGGGDFMHDGGGGGGGGGGGPWRGNRGSWRGRGGGRGGPFDNGFGHRGMQPPRFRGGRGGFMGPGNRGAGPRGPPNFMGNRGGKFRPSGPHGGDAWSNNGPPHGGMGGPGGMGPGPDGAVNNSEENIWAEAKTPDGKSYFYHTETRETTWERPVGPGVKIIRHEEVGSVTSKNSGNMKSDNFPPESENPMGQNNPPGKPMNTSAPNNNQNQPAHGMNQDVAPAGNFGMPPHGGPFNEHMPPAQLQPPPNSLQGPPGPSEGNDGVRLPMMNPNPTVRPNIPFGMPPQFRPPAPMFSTPGPDGGPGQLPPDGKPPMDVLPPRMPQLAPPQPHPGQGFPAFPPVGAPPQFVMQPPPMFPQNMPFAPAWGPLGGVTAPTGVPPPLFNVEPVAGGIDPKVVAKAFEWSEHVSPDGKTYFYNSKTNMSVWEKPAALAEYEEAQKFNPNRTPKRKQPEDQDASPVVESAKAKEAKKADAKKAEKCRPISSTPVAGTPWCVVWTGDKRVFFFNPSTKQSVWDRPKELVGRMDVDELVRNCPDKSEAKVKKVEATSTTSPQTETEKNIAETNKEVAVEEKQPPAVGLTENDGDGDPPAKKLKRDEANDDRDESEKSNNEEEDNDVVEIKDDEKSKLETKDSLKDVNASEAEARAAKERANHPLEVRLKQFRDMLIEKQVSAFSTWEKELHKIVFDSRYLLLTSKERKAAFENYVKERAEEERKEKKTRMKQVKEHFMKFLDEVLSHQYPRLSYNEFIQKYGRDERFKAVEKSRDRESYFLEFVSELKRREREERANSKEKVKDQFLDFLKDKVFDYHLKWSDMKKKLEHDSRFSVLDSDEKEDLFRIHQKKLKAEAKARKKRKKAKNKEKARRLKERAQRELSEEVESGHSSNKVDYKSDDSKSEKMEDISEEEEGCITDDSEEDSRERERKEREAASMREREKEVQRALAGHLRDREKEREHYRHEEAVQEFQSLLTDIVRTSDVTWKDVKKAAKRDGRWEAVAILPKEEMEDLFLQHCEHISRKKKQRFRELLEEAGVKINSTWKEIKKKIKEDPRYVKFSTSERKCEREFDLYLKDKTSAMKTEFRELLKETKTLNYRTKQQIRESPHILKDIEALLGKDKRYLIMDSMPDERHRLLVEYLDDLERKGVPPPPTASEPSRRMK